MLVFLMNKAVDHWVCLKSVGYSQDAQPSSDDDCCANFRKKSAMHSLGRIISRP